MRAILLLALLLAPTASAAWTLEVQAPSSVAAGIPFSVRACIDEDAEIKASLTATGRYARTVDGCAEFELTPPDAETTVTLTVKARPPGRDAKVVVTQPIRVSLAPESVWIESAWGVPFDGVVLNGSGNLSGLALGVPLPNVSIEGPTFVGRSAPPGYSLIELAKVKPHLTRAKHVISSIAAKPGPGQFADALGAHDAGRTNLSAEWVDEDGRIEVAVASADAFVRVIDRAQKELLVEAYTLTSMDIAAAMARAIERGVVVRLLLEGAPVGGIPSDEKGLLAALEERGASVSFLRSAKGFPARYQSLHSKVVAADREVLLVSTENLHEDSSSRGYVLVAHSRALAERFALGFAADAAAWPDVQPYAGDSVELAGRALRPPSGIAFEGKWRGAVVFSPDASGEVERLIRGAQSSVQVEMLFADARDNPLLDALAEADARGVNVSLRLDGFVDAGRNRLVAERFAWATLDESPRTLHAKVVLVDGKFAYVGSMNWGKASMEKNREVGLLVESPVVVEFLVKEFGRDARGREDRREAPGEVWVAVAAFGLSAIRRAPLHPCVGRART